jgi:CHAT domain-containing protein
MSSGPTAGDAAALAWAEEAHALVQVHPRRARALAERALAAASAEGNVQAEIVARHALAWAQKVLGDAHAGRATLKTGIRLAEQRGDRRGVGLLRRSLAMSHTLAGETLAARREIDAALVLLSGRERAQSQVHRLEIHRKAHATDPATHRQVCTEAAKALRLLRREGDEIWEARLLFNRGLLHLDRGELDRADADLRRAQTLYARVGAKAAAVNAFVFVAEVALLRGDVLTCLKALEQVQPNPAPGELNHEYNLENLQECRVMALAQARLLPEARAAAEVHAKLCARTGRGDSASPAMLDLAAVALRSADPAAARRFATRAARMFIARGMPVNAALARAAVLRARLLEGSLGRSSVRSGLDAISVLETAGWRRDALRTRLLVARIALATGSDATAARQLELARPLWSRGTVADRIELCHVRALLRVADGDSVGAERLLEQGFRLLDEYQAALGAVELRATASGIGIELSHVGLRIALESREPVKILGWAERLRANALRLPALRPPADKKLRDLQTELRRAAAASRVTQQAQLESAIRARARLVDAADAMPTSLPDIREIARQLGDRVLVEYVELDGVLSALMIVNGRLALHELGAVDATAELGWLRFALARLARGGNSAAQRAALLGNAQAAAATLDSTLIEPLLPALGEAPLVLVPTGSLHAVPWAALPSLHGRPLVVAPSLSVWSTLDKRQRSRRRKVALIAGPRLRHATTEVRDVAALYKKPTVLQGKAATAKATLAALDGAALAHVACHGHFRSDSPLFSSLELADGLLNVYELQNLRQAPDVVVLSACDLATSDLHPGDELLGVAAALLVMGTRTIVASVVPVPDAAVKRLMLAFHRNLLDGHAPAAALARAQSRASVAGFVCLGSG